MSQTRVSQFFQQKEIAKINQAQTLIDTFAVKEDQRMFHNEVICLNLRKKEETVCPVGRSRKFNNSISANELHDFNDTLKFDKW